MFLGYGVSNVVDFFVETIAFTVFVILVQVRTLTHKRTCFILVPLGTP